MNRRDFLQTLSIAAASGVVSSCAQAQILPAVPRSASQKPGAVLQFAPNRTIRGVNLGGWLLLEKWISPSLFDGMKAPDEYSFGAETGGAARLRKHRENYITDADFAWIAARGLDAVRLPVGYWILESDQSYIAAPDILDRAFQSAKAHNLGVFLDLHGAPGSQNGRDHGGRNGPMEWASKPENIAKTLDVLESFAQKYGEHPNLIGIGTLNEPDYKTPMPLVQEFSQAAVERIRKHTKPEIAVVIHDAFRPYEWADFAAAQGENVILDAHLYQCYSADDKARSFAQHIEKAAIGRQSLLGKMQKQLPAIVGEWSLCLRGPGVDGASAFQTDTGRRAYAAAQLLSYEDTRGWFFWTYQTESRPDWSLRESVNRGWMPDSYRVV